jgi:cyanate lyase
VVELLDLDEEVGRALQEIPLRGVLDQDVPTDPTIYWIHEGTQVYGTTIKALINEEFGDGIMSATTSHMDIEKEESTLVRASRSPTTASSFPTLGSNAVLPSSPPMRLQPRR